jgi:drug/metabolite transporter (DMT)-like permease
MRENQSDDTEDPEKISNAAEVATSDAQSAQGIAYYLTKFNPLTFRQRGRKTKAIAALVMVCFFWGTTWLASKEGVSHMPALQLAGIRQLLGGLCYIIFFFVKRVRWPRGREWNTILILSFLNFMLSNALSTWGVQFIPAGLGSIIGAIFPMWLVIIGMFGARTKLDPKSIWGLVLGFTGICVIFYKHLDSLFDADFRFGIILSLLSTWTWAFGTLYTKKVAAHFNPYFSLGLQMFISGIVIVSLTEVTGLSVSIAEIPWRSWAAIGYLVIFGSVITFVAYLYALQNLPTEQVSIYAYINPIVAVILGFIIFNEPLNAFIVMGVLITLYGVYLVNKTAKKLK